MPFARAATPRRSSWRRASRQAPARPPDTLRVPAQATPCVGRGREIAQLTGLLADPAVRLVTLTGAGGMGKTRLALAVAQQLVDDARRRRRNRSCALSRWHLLCGVGPDQ